MSDGVELRLVGTGDAFGNGGRFQTCLVLTHGTEAVMIDCGASSLTALKAQGVEPNDIGTVVLTHLHGDHFGGLPFLILDGQFRRRERPLTIAGPPETAERLHAAMDVLFPGSGAARRRFETTVIELEFDRPTPVGPAFVRTLAVELPDTPACVLRVEFGGKVVVYTGDTAWVDGLVDLAAGADLLGAESYFRARRPVPPVPSGPRRTAQPNGLRPDSAHAHEPGDARPPGRRRFRMRARRHGRQALTNVFVAAAGRRATQEQNQPPSSRGASLDAVVVGGS